MKVKLISYSKPTDSISDEGIDNAQELVAFVREFQIHQTS